MTSLVVKIGGHALDSLRPGSDAIATFASDINDLRAAHVTVVVVHGGGPQIETLLERVGLASRFENGLRITDEETMAYVAMALGEVNCRLVAAFNKAGLVAAGANGVDASMLHATAMGPPWGRAGSSPTVDVTLITTLWAAGITPVVTSIAADEYGHLVNCNADTAAGALAGALGASTLVLLSDVAQLRADPNDEGSALARVNSEEVRGLLESGAARDGMRPKLAATLDALDGGAARVLVASGTNSHALRDALRGDAPTTEVRR